MPRAQSDLLPFRRASASARVRLVCLPFAGGAASVYRDWSTELPPWVDVCAVELAGRGTRFGEPFEDDLGRVSAALLEGLATLGELPTVVFGHSMGARLGFHLVRAGLRARSLIASGSRAPSIAPRRRADLPEREFIDEIVALGGTPREVLEDRELLELFIPLLRADLRLVERMVAPETASIEVPLVVLRAAGDTEAPAADVEAWAKHAAAGCRMVEMPGGHFFVTTHRDAVLAEVRRVLEAELPP